MRALAPTLAVLAGCGRIGFEDRGGGDAPVARDARARSRLMVDRQLPTTPLADFPLPVILNDTRADLSLLAASSFRAFAGTTELDVEVETVNGENPFVAWVRVP